MNFLEVIKQQIPTFDRIDINPVIDGKGVVVGWESISYLRNDQAFSGGTHVDKEVAKRICIAEAFERAFFFKIFGSKSSDDFLLSEFPSTCGFSCGFESEKVRLRAICEGVERWAWSQWIDFSFHMDEVEIEKVDALSDSLCRIFEKKRFFSRHFEICNLKLQLGIVVCETDQGIFAGSRVCSLMEDPWQHAIIEASRNYQNFRHFQENFLTLKKEDFVRRRAIYFGANKDEALAQIGSAIKNDWPSPTIRILKEYDTGIPNVFLWRCLLENWMGWHIGDEKRFVY